MKKAALVTSSSFPDLPPDEALVIPHLLKMGIQGIPAVWNDHSVNWENFDLIILRSPWDYSEKFPEFLAWLKMLQSMNLPLANPYPIIYWNFNKSYLRELHERGCLIPPTVWLKKGETANLSHLLKKEGWDKAVIKPTISAGGRQARLVSRETSKELEPYLIEKLTQMDVMVQKFMPAIYSEGEWGLIFMNGVYSHAVLKHPGENDFRVQPYYGGTAEGKQPPAWVIEKARKIVQTIQLPCLYARVDGLVVHHDFLLMELELLEPFLYLACHPNAPERFAKAIAELMERERNTDPVPVPLP